MYQLAKNILVREDDKSLFDSKSFRMIQLNTTGYRLIRSAIGSPIGLDKLILVGKSLNLTSADVKSFLEKCLKVGFLERLSTNQ